MMNLVEKKFKDKLKLPSYVIRSPPFLVSSSPCPKLSSFRPKEDQIKDLCKSCLKSHKITELWHTTGDLHNLTFIFSDGTQSPKRGWYKGEPDSKLPVKQDSKGNDLHVASVKFVTRKYIDDFFLAQFYMESPEGYEVVDVKFARKFDAHSSQTVQFFGSEHIVSVRVDIDKTRKRAVSIRFIIYDH